MKANELRIGNYLQDNVTKTTVKVVELSKDCISTYVIDRSKYPLKDGWKLEPIPLTEEWLLRFGFRKKASFSDHTIHIDMTNILCLDNDNNESEFSAVSIYDVDEGVWIYLESIQYVHQLQNLYFVLSREELKLKDDENH